MDHNLYIISADEILPGIWLGNQAVSQSRVFMEKHNISLIVNATKNINSKFLGKIHYVRIPVDDPGALSTNYNNTVNENIKIMKKSIGTILNIIRKFKARGKNILIHCHAGAQRSAIIMACYLVKYEMMSPNSSIEYIIKKRPAAFFGGKSINFKDVLY